MCLKSGNKHIVKIIAKSVNVLMFLNNGLHHVERETSSSWGAFPESNYGRKLCHYK